MPLWLLLGVCLFSLAMFALQLAVYSSGSKAMDGYSYFEAWDVLRTFHPDQLRPPLYPVFAGVIRDILGERGALIAIPLIQWIAYIFSVRLAWNIARRLGATRGLNIAATLMYLVFPGMWMLNNLTVPEPLCGLGLLVLTALTDRFLQTRRMKHLLLGFVTVTALIFTKVMYIFLLPVLLVVWIYASHKSRRLLAASLTATAVAAGLVLVYSLCIKSVCTQQGLTKATDWNRYVALRMEGLIIPDDIPDPGLRETFRPYYETDKGHWSPGENIYWHETWSFNWRDLNRLCDYAEAAHPREALSMRLSYLVRTLPFSQFRYVEPGPDPETDPSRSWNGLTPLEEGGYIFPLHRWLWFPIWVGWLITGLFSVLWIYRWIRRRRFPALPFFIAASVTAGFLSIIISAPDDWGRLMTSLDLFLPLMLSSSLSLLFSGFHFIPRK